MSIQVTSRLGMVVYNHRSPDNEASVAKGIPMNWIKVLKANWPGKYRYRYRGPSTTEYDRSPYHCLAKYATSFAIYERK